MIDDQPAIWSSVVPWLTTALDLARIPPSCIHLHHVCPLPPDLAALCRSRGVHTHAIAPFHVRCPHANKIQQCGTDFSGARRVVLTDVDMAFAGPPPLEEIQAAVAGKVVDHPNPPMDILRAVFAAAGVAVPALCSKTYQDAQDQPVSFATFAGNFNGGLYMIERERLVRLGEAWARWALWLIARIDLLSHWAKHADQVAFCLAVNELGLATGVLDEAWNFPLHLNLPPGGRAPFILHHHAQQDDQQRLTAAPTPQTQDALSRVNRAIEARRA